MVNILTFIGFFLFTCAGMVFIKLGAQHNVLFTVPVLDFKLSALSFVGFLTYGISFVLYSSLLTKYDLSFLNPFTIGITAVLIFICGLTLFHETLTLAKVAGLALILSGVFVLNVLK